MPINFPDAPSANDTHTDVNGTVWTFDGTAWSAAPDSSTDVRTFWPVAEMQPSNATASFTTIGSTSIVPAGTFRDANTDQWYLTIKSLPSWVGSSVDVSVLVSTGATTTGGNVRLQGIIAQYDIDEAPGSPTDSGQANYACPTTAHQIFEVPLLTGFAVTKEFVNLRVLRWATSAEDTLDAILYIVGVRVAVNP